MGCGSSTTGSSAPGPFRSQQNSDGSLTSLNRRENGKAQTKEKDAEHVMLNKNEPSTATKKDSNVDGAEKGLVVSKASVPVPSTKDPSNTIEPPPPPPPPSPPPVQPASSGSLSVKPERGVVKKNSSIKNKAALDFRKLGARVQELQRHMRNLLTAKAEPEFVSKIIRGNLDTECPSVARIVRIFISSTFTDTCHERNWLMEKVYPKLKTLCQSKGYDFQAVDMRWGIRDEAQDDHMTTEICLKEVELCKQQSTGPCFVSLMSHKYGYRDFPRQIKADEFEKLIEGVEDESAKELLLRWFKRDDNTVPPIYVLQPISSQIPDAKSDVEKIRKAAMEDWNTKYTAMHSALAQSSAKLLDPPSADKFRQSISEAEVAQGLENCSMARFLWFRRIITDIDEVDKNAEGDILRKYRDISDSSEKDEESKQLLTKLEETTLTSKLLKSNIFEYSVKWEPKKGIDAESPSHREYLEKLCQDAESHITSLLQKSFKERDQFFTGNPLFYEILQHTVFCKEKCKSFYGREGCLKQIEDYLKGSSKKPFIIHGKSGCGKTSLVAMAAQMAHQLNGEMGVNVIRFIGTTPESCSLPGLLISVINQLRYVLRLELTDLGSGNPKVLTPLLSKFLEEAGKKHPTVIVLDSLDQFEMNHKVQQLRWLPSVLPEGVKLIVSTLPEEEYEFLPNLKARFKDTPENFLDVPQLEDSDITGILDKWLGTAGRTLSAGQRVIVLNAFKNCPLPLFLKLSFDEACKWKSYYQPSMTVLNLTIRGCIESLFISLETLHGKIFVSKALGYLTASDTGLSEAELEDILSCDDDVLRDVCRFWTPPIRRLPPLLLVRMKRDVGQYVVNRGADGKQVFYWYHRQFIEAARDRYCNDKIRLTQLHEGLANFFSGTWGDGNVKPYLERDGQEVSADRHTAPQPLRFGDSLNIRRLSNEPHHWIKAEKLDKVKSKCLLNYDFLMAKLEACGLRAVLDDFHEARNAFLEDQALQSVSEAMYLSQNALLYDLRTFPSQMLGRIRNKKILSLPEVHQLLTHCKEPGFMYLEPDRPILEPSRGQLVHSIADHKETLPSALVLNKSGTIALTCQAAGELKVYDIAAGKVIRKVIGMDGNANTLRLAKDDSIVIANVYEKLCAYDIQTGAKLWAFSFTDDEGQFVTGGPGYSLVLIVTWGTYTFLNAETGQVVGEAQTFPDSIPTKIRFAPYTPAVGHEKYMVMIEQDQKGAFVFDPITRSLSHFRRVLQSYKNEKNEKVDATVDGLQISPDGETLYMLCVANCFEKSETDLYFVETKTLEKIKSYPGCTDELSGNFHISGDGKYCFSAHESYVRVWDLETGKKATILRIMNMNSSIVDVASVDMRIFVTINSDKTLKILDITRGDQPEMQFEDLSRDHRVLTSNVDLSTFIRLESPRYFFQMIIDKSKEPSEQMLQIFDTSTATFVFQVSQPLKDSDDGLSCLEYLGDWTLAFEHKNRMKLLDLRTMKVTTVIQGKWAQYCRDILMVNGGKELAHVSKGRMNLVIASRETGKTVAVIKAGQKKRIELIITDKTGTQVAAQCNGSLIIFNITQRTFELEITSKMMKTPKYNILNLDKAIITPNGNYILFLSYYKIPKEKLTQGIKQEYVMSTYVFNIPKKTLEHVLVDIEHYELLQRLKLTDKEVDVNSMQLIDDHRLVSTHDDHIVRIFDYTQGTLLHRLEGHTSDVSLDLLEGSNILVTITNGHWDEEYAVRLWNMTSLECFAVYRSEFDLKNLQMIGPKSCSLIGQFKSDINPIILSIKGQGSEELKANSIPEVSFPAIFENRDEVRLDISHPNDSSIDEDDPDTDEEEKDDDDEEEEEEISDDDAWLNGD